MKYHMIAFAGGFLLDLILGDPYCLPHPIRWIGSLIYQLDRIMLGDKTSKISRQEKRIRGVLLVLIMLLVTFFATTFILIGSYKIHVILGVCVELIMTYQIFALKCLKVESMKVYHSLCTEPLEEAQKKVAMIVGRDTKVLDETGVCKAAIETVAENTSDGVIAPMIFTAIGGPVLGFLYKTVNTMDSMVGYKNDRYLDFGRAAAKLDDFCNFIPARLTAYLMILSCAFLGKDYSLKNAYRIYKRDRRKHASPNSAQTESVCAGALGIQLAGNASYFGKVVEKPYIGDATRTVEFDDIKRANRMMYMTAFLTFMICEGCFSLLYCLL